MTPSKPVAAAKKAASEVADAVADAVSFVDKPVPGAPGSEPPSLEEPTEPREVPPPKPDQQQPTPVSPTGAPSQDPPTASAQQGAYLTTATGVRIGDSDHSLKAGPRGPTLLSDHHLREKIMHFDHERIPERVVHARGAGAHGVFVANGAASKVSRAAVFADGEETPTFVRFSTVLGSRGSADTVRDTRGFATKFYTSEGNWDLVGNNIPVFFIQDGIKFPDVIHAGKPHPDREIPQAQSAHDTFWDFVSLHTEAQHHTIWNMSDRGIPRSYRMMEGFGVHTFRLVDAEGGTTLVKFHWKPRLGVHSLTWEEAQLAGGVDPDFHRRDLYDAIESGAFPAWDLGIQTFPDTPDQMFEGIDLLDATKMVPEELAPVQVIGTLTLNGNPTNFFAETEQVAFHTGHLVPGIDGTDDPLLMARNFSYLDTQLTRLAGPNFNQIPINRPHAPVNDNHRDGFHQQAVHGGVAPYKPNSLDAGCPFFAGADEGAFVDVPVEVQGSKVRENPASFDDHYSQARLFWLSMSPVEQEHIVNAYSFELGKCYEQAIKERQLLSLANIDDGLCARVAAALGLVAPERTVQYDEPASSPALSQLGETWPADGRLVGLVVDPDGDLSGVAALREELLGQGLLPLLIAPRGGDLGEGLVAQRTFATARSVEFDAVVLTGAAPPAADALASRDGKAGDDSTVLTDPRVGLLVQECFRQCKAVVAVGDGRAVVEELGLVGAGVLTGDGPSDVGDDLLALLGAHRSWERFATSV